MDGTRFRLFRVRGIPVYVDLSWFLVFGLLTWSLAAGAAGSPRDGFSTDLTWALAATTAAGFFACIVLHELGHAVVGQAHGLSFRGITLFVLGGVAELDSEPPSARSEFWMAIAGPAVSGVLALVFAALAVLARGIDGAAPVMFVLDHLALMNAGVMLFNLVPAYPMDGGRVFRSAVWAWTGDLRRASLWATLAGSGLGHLLLMLGVIGLIRGSVVEGLWMAFVGLFVAHQARLAYDSAVVADALGGRVVGQLMNPDPLVVRTDLSLRQLVEDYVFLHHRKCFPVVTAGKVVGLVRAETVREIPRDDWDRSSVVDVMERDIRGRTIRPDEKAAKALRQMQQTGSTYLLVMDGESLVGMLSLRDLMNYLELMGEDRADDTDFETGGDRTDARQVGRVRHRPSALRGSPPRADDRDYPVTPAGAGPAARPL
jgi:Zn-dependent protease/CBS domain-containing protein